MRRRRDSGGLLFCAFKVSSNPGGIALTAANSIQGHAQKGCMAAWSESVEAYQASQAKQGLQSSAQ